MYTTQSKMISRAIWVEKKHVWKINLQKNGVRKSFYSSVPGDKGRKICAQNATSWLSGACPFKKFVMKFVFSLLSTLAN